MNGKVYKITNILNGKVYIGQTIRTLKVRMQEHCKRLNPTYISRAIKKYGKENFLIELLEEQLTTQEELNEKEAWYINFFESNIKGYNICGDVRTPGKWTEQMKLNQSVRMKLQHKTVKMKEASHKSGLSRRGITSKPNGSKSKYVGVHYSKVTNKYGSIYEYWRASAKYKNKTYTIGNFKTQEEAAKAYNKFALEYFGKDAILNII